MSDHKFEEQVQKKMEELRLSPSASVWQGVEKEIQGSPRRRRFIWIPLLVLVTGLGGFLLFRSFIPGSNTPVELSQKETRKPHSSQAPVVQNTPHKKPSANKPASDLPGSPDAEQPIPLEPKLQESPKQQDGLSSHQQSVIADSDNRKHDIIIPGNRNRKNDISDVARNNKGRNLPPLPGKKNVNEKKPAIVSDDTVPAANVQNNYFMDLSPVARVAAAGRNASEVTEPGSALYHPIAMNTFSKTADHAKPGKQRSSRHFKFGIQGFSGVSGINNGGLFSGGIFGANKSAVSDVAPSASMNSFVQGNAIRYKPSAIQPGLAFGIGGFIQKDMGKRTAFSAGISYTRFSTRITVGERVQSTAIVNNYRQGYSMVAAYYRPEQTFNFTNRYHFLQVPVQFLWTLNKSQRLPLTWSFGAAYSRLISSDALQFDGTTGIYYKNNDLLNRDLLELSTGFSAGLFSKSRLPVSVGPSIRYQVSEQLKKGANDNKHFLSLGVDLKFYLKK